MKDKILGVGVSKGAGFGKAFVVKKEEIIVPQNKIKACEVKDEIEKVNSILEKLKQDTLRNYSLKDKKNLEILNAYVALIEDQDIKEKIKMCIEKDLLNGALALEKVFESFLENFDSINDEYLKSRKCDVRDIKNRILQKILQIPNQNVKKLPKDSILVCENLTLSDMIKMDLENLVGVITEKGSKNSHSLIILRNLEIPAVCEAKNILDFINTGDFVALNGTSGEIVKNPGEEELRIYKKIKFKSIFNKTKLGAYRNSQSLTADNKPVKLLANIAKLNEVEKLIANGAEGIGLFRSEFLFLDKNTLPTEEEQFLAYKKLVMQMPRQVSTIRTIDLGGEKNVFYPPFFEKENSSFDIRGIKLSLLYKDVFRMQLRAILRASIFGNVQIMLPMVSSVQEIKETKIMIKEIKKELVEENIPFNDNIKLGITIETPASAIIAEVLAKEVDFLSIGTNDLIQYTVAMKRQNPVLNDMYSAFHPAVLKLIYNTINAAHQNNIPCGICGEIASDLMLFPLWVGMGVDFLSMGSGFILALRKTLSSLSIKRLTILKNEVLSMTDEVQIKNHLESFYKRFICNL